MSNAIVNTGIKVRSMVLHTAESIEEGLFDIQPAAFNNSIRWNLGHIIVSLDGLLSKAIPFHSNLPESYRTLFGTGSKPSGSEAAMPSKAELIQYLKQQMGAISEIPAERLDEQLSTPVQLGPMTFETAGDIINFTFIHETMHWCAINSLKKVITHEQK